MTRSGICAFIGLVIMLAPVTQGAAAFCDVTKNKSFHQCYGALGQSVFIQLINDTKGYQFALIHNNKTFIRFRKEKVVRHLCCDFSNNGTLRLDKAERNYSGQYILEIHNENGKHIQTKEIQLTLEEPVSTPVLSILCQINGELKVSCSAGGDNPRYNWKLEDWPLGEKIPHMNYGGGVVVLGKGVSGDLTCTAWNNVSSESRTQSLPTCSELGPPVNCTLSNGTEIAVRMNATEGLSLLGNKKIFFTLDGREILSALCYSKPKPTSNQKDTAKKNDDCPKTEEPVSTPVLSTLCQINGELKVSCSAGGDNPRYNWTLGDRPLGENIPHMNYGGGVVVLGKGVSGDLTCTAWNNVSSESRTQSLPTCSGCSVLFCVSLGTAFLLSVLAVLLYYRCKKKRSAEAPKDHDIYEVTLKGNKV